MIRASSALVVMLSSGIAAAAQGEQIVARHSGKCLTVQEQRGALNGMLHQSAIATVVQMQCEQSRTTQEWRTVPQMGGTVQIQSISQNQCLTVAAGSTANNAALTITACGQGNNARGQLWEMKTVPGRGTEVLSAQSHKCVDVENGGTGDGVRVVQFDCGRGDQQLFEIRAAGQPQVLQTMQPNANVPPPPQPQVLNGTNNANIAGNWRWSNNTTVDFMDNGTARSSTGQTARWVREDGRRFVVNWAEGWVDRVVLSDDGQHLQGSNQNGGQVRGDRAGGPAYNAPGYNAPGYNPPPSTPPPGQQQAMSVGNTVLRENGEHADPNNCGAGNDDPGCTMNRNGARPLDQREFTLTLDNLRRQHDENQRHNQLGPVFNNRVMTARQLGALIDLFPNETMRLEVAKERARSVLDPEHLHAFGGRFRNPAYRQEYETTVQNAEREARGGGGGAMQTLRGATIRR